jgi:hypothetical protein
MHTYQTKQKGAIIIIPRNENSKHTNQMTTTTINVLGFDLALFTCLSLLQYEEKIGNHSK